MQPRGFWTNCRALCWALLAIAILAPPSTAHTRATAVTWAKDIAPILARRCASCHVNGGTVVTRLGTYEEARAQAKAIRQEVLEGRMPPWPAARGVGRFSNDRSLSPVEIELLTAWADGSTPLGKPDERPAPLPVVASAPAEPLVELRIPAGHPSTRRIERFEISTRDAGTTWIRGWHFQAGDPTVIERVVASVSGGEQIGSWVPGDEVVRLPAGVGQRLPPKAIVAVELHYRKNALVVSPESRLTFYLSPPPRFALQHRTLSCGSTRISSAADALAIAPLAPGAGDSLEALVRRPDGSVEPLVIIPQFQPAYPLTYRFRRFVPLPAGTRIDLRASAGECSAILDFITRVPGRPAAR